MFACHRDWVFICFESMRITTGLGVAAAASTVSTFYEVLGLFHKVPSSAILDFLQQVIVNQGQRMHLDVIAIINSNRVNPHHR